MSESVVAVVDDMFFASKIRATGEALGVTITFVNSIGSLLDKVRQVRPHLVVVDLHHQKLRADEIGRQLKSDEELRGIKLLGFFSHVNTDLQKNALNAGFDEVIPRSVFARDLAKLLSVKGQGTTN